MLSVQATQDSLQCTGRAQYSFFLVRCLCSQSYQAAAGVLQRKIGNPVSARYNEPYEYD